jgi:hypothetical protein
MTNINHGILGEDRREAVASEVQDQPSKESRESSAHTRINKLGGRTEPAIRYCT